MKLIVSGATGFVGKEVIRQSLSRREITSVVALARKPAPAPEDLGDDGDPSKLKSVVVIDYEDYPDEVKREFSGASACIWTVAITPTKSKMYDFDEVKRVCQTSTLAGLRAMHDAGPARPFRFLYTSGAGVERDQSKTPRFYGQYSLMRGETENQILSLAAELGGIEVGFARPGLITRPGAIVRSVLATALGWAVGIHSISVTDLAAVMLDQAIKGFEKEPLMPGDLARLAERRSEVSVDA
ncbi:putative nucleoside-diphosphate-sugar epimerase [Biscogniauxia marginata]|nr:putative nucleoside-diphosphate-sugar epimerase [Biscogniauxia marginata]